MCWEYQDAWREDIAQLTVIKASQRMHIKCIGNKAMIKSENSIQKDPSGVKAEKSIKGSHEDWQSWPGELSSRRTTPLGRVYHCFEEKKEKHLSISSLTLLINDSSHKMLMPLNLEFAQMSLRGARLKPGWVCKKLSELTQNQSLPWCLK